MIKPTTIYKLILMAAICFLSFSVYTYSSAPPAGNAGDPSGSNCTSCHSGSVVTSGTSWTAIALTGTPANGYIPGTVYTLTVNGNTASTAKNGFQITSLSATNAMAGTIAAGTGTILSTSGSKTYISHNGNNGGSWSFNWTAPATGTGTITFYACFLASNSSSSDVGDVVYKKTFTLNEASLNTPTAIITSSSNTVCLGDTLFLTGSGANNPTAFNWQFLNNTPSTATGQSTYVIYTSLGVKTIKLTTSNVDGNSPTVQKNISVVAKPTATISINGQSICGSDSLNLTANTGANFSYLWLPGNLTTQSIYVKDSVNYTVKVSNINGCFAVSTPVKPTKVAYPQSTLITSKDTICKQDSILFDLTGTGFTAYYYVNDTLANQNINNLGYVLKRNAGVYKLNVKIMKLGCTTNVSEKYISIQQQAEAPTIQCGNNTTSTLAFTWNKVGNNNAYEVSTNNGSTWSDANGLNQLSHNIVGLQPNSSITLLARAKSNGPCGSGLVATKTCINNGCNKINSLFSYKKAVCVGINNTVVPIEVSNISNSKYHIQFSTDSIVGLFNRNTLFNFNATVGNNLVHIKIKDSTDNVCPTTDTTITIKGNANPAIPSLSSIKTNPIYCKGENIIITAFKSSSSHLYSFFQIIPERKLLQTSFDNSINLKGKLSGIPFNTIKAIAVDTNTLCADSSLQMNIIENPKPKANFTFEYFKSDTNNVNKNLVVFTNLSGDSINSMWFFGDSNNTTSSLKNPTFTYKKGGNFTAKLIATNTSNCSDTLAKQVLITNTSIEDLIKQLGLKLYPNPTTDFLTIEINETGKNALYSILDMNGKTIETHELLKLQTVSINHLLAGTYFIKYELNSKIIYSKFIKK